MSDNWFGASKEGLSKIARRRGLSYVLYELVSNSWDTGAKKIAVSFEALPNRPRVWMRVEDDDPDGFTDITHAWVLFAESLKKSDPTKRGKFNLGEKLVLAVCEEAEIISTRSSVIFSPDGERKTGRRRRESGSLFEGLVKMNREDLAEVLDAAKYLIPPPGVETTVNGTPLQAREILHELEITLPTEVADEMGYLKTRERKTLVRVHRPIDGVGRIYEMGIPVCETGDPWDVNVFQKVPVNLERNSVTPAYLKALRVHVFNAMQAHIGQEEASSPAALSVLGDSRAEQATVEKVLKEQYGENIAFEDPKDPEAENRLKAEGFTILKRRSFSSDVRAVIDKFGAVKKAGELSPTPMPYSTDPDARPRELVPEEAWTDGMKNIARYAQELAEHLIHQKISVVFDTQRGSRFSAAYGGRELTFFINSLGRPYFDFGPTESMNSLLLHEFAHEAESNHLSDNFYKALQSMGARMTSLALREPDFFKRFGWRG